MSRTCKRQAGNWQLTTPRLDQQVVVSKRLQGESKRQFARELDTHKETVKERKDTWSAQKGK